MSREIDRLASPATKRKMKVIVASASRTGTLSLYAALQILGYRPYHFVEALFHPDPAHMRVAGEAITAQHNRLSGIKPYSKDDFERWFADYDSVVELPSFLGPAALESYAGDPDVKFILSERSPEKWARSFHKTAGQVAATAASFPMNILKHFDAQLKVFMDDNQLCYWCHSGGVDPGEEESLKVLEEGYIRYIETAKRILPKDQTHVIRLEDGLGWEDICPFLGVPIPEADYPPPNNPEMFEAIVTRWLKPRIRKAMLNMGAVVVPVLGVVGYTGWRLFWPAR